MKRLFVALIFVASSAYGLTLSGGAIGPGKPDVGRLIIRPHWFDVTAGSLSWRVVSQSSSTTVQIQDRVYKRDVAAVSVSDVYWAYYVSPGHSLTGPIARSSSNPAVIIPDPSDETKWTWVSNGSATLTISSPDRTVTYSPTVSTSSPSTVDTFQNLDPASAAQNILNNVNSRISGKTSSASLPIFSTQNHAGSFYVRNTGVWAEDVDLTAISPWNSTGGNTRAGVLISPRHVLFAAHYQIAIGATIRFVASDNTVVTRTITAVRVASGYSPYYPDYAIGLLDQSVPSSISFVKFLPDSWASKLPSIGIVPVYSVGTDQNENLSIRYVNSLNAQYPSPTTYLVRFQAPQPADPVLPWYETIVGGDSGNPQFLLINGELVLNTVYTFGGAGSGTSLTYQKAAINSDMSALGGGYQITEADLSSFPSY